MSARVTAIIVTYRSAPTIGACLEALLPAFRAGELDVVVVDNHSDDDTCAVVARDFPWVDLRENGANLGFARANNLGLRGGTSEYVLFLNPDAVVDREAIQRLVQFLDHHPAAGLAGPAIENERGGLQESFVFPRPLDLVLAGIGRLPRRRWPSPIQPGSAPRRADWICGAVMLARRAIVDQVGGFDPRFFLYYEETDLCRRAADAGAETWVVGDARARHVGHASSDATTERLYHGCLAEHYFASRYYYLTKHFGWLRATVAECIDRACARLRRLAYSVFARPIKPDDIVRLGAPFLRRPARTDAESV